MRSRLKEVKEQIAKELNYKDWEHCINDQPNFGVEKVMDIVALRLWNSSLQLNEKYTPEFEDWLQYQQKDIKFDKYILNDTYLNKEQMFEYWESDKQNL